MPTSSSDFNPHGNPDLPSAPRCGFGRCGCGLAKPQRRLFTGLLAGAAITPAWARDGVDVGSTSRLAKLVPAEQVEGILGIVCPQMIYPYLRAIVSDVCTRAGFPPVLLSEVNFQAMFEAQQAQREAASAGANGSTALN